MALIAKADSNGSFTPVPTGLHLARCYRIIDLGTQESEYMGVKKMLQKVMLQFEVHSEDESGNPTVTAKGEPLSISKNFTLSLGEKATLRTDLKTWRGRDFTHEELRGFELKNVLGVWCTLSIIKAMGRDGTKEYTNISGIMPVSVQQRRAGLPNGFNEPKLYSIDEHDQALFETFSDNLRAKIMASPEFKMKTGNTSFAAPASQVAANIDDDDIPFN
jgi:hypothetical protein